MNQNDQSIEEAIIGAALLQPESLETIMILLKPEHFYNDLNRQVFTAIHDLFKKNQKTDLLTVIDELKRKNILESIGGVYFVSGLVKTSSSPSLIDAHCRILIQKQILRKLGSLSALLQYRSNEAAADCFEVMEWLQKELRQIEDGLQYNKTERIDSIIEKEIKEMRETLSSGIKPGIKCQIQALNNQTSGWQKGDLIILAGRPGMGKTSAALDFALYPALNGSPAAVFSLEMSKSQLSKRVLSLISSMPVQKIVTKNLNAYDVDLLEKDGKILNDIPFFIDDSASINLTELSAKARRLKREQNIELIVVDYIQLMGGVESKFGNREQEISRISRGLKLLAKELEIPIIALSQLSRAVELRTDKKPQLSDLRESGAIEQDADLVIFCFRPEYYGFDTYNIGSIDESSFGLFIFIIAKFRQGQPGEIKARWIGELTKIDNY